MIGDATQRSAARRKARRGRGKSCWPRRELAASPSRRVQGFAVEWAPEPSRVTVCQTDGELYVRPGWSGSGSGLNLVWSGLVRAWMRLQGQAAVAEEWRRACVCLLPQLNFLKAWGNDVYK